MGQEAAADAAVAVAEKRLKTDAKMPSPTDANRRPGAGHLDGRPRIDGEIGERIGVRGPRRRAPRSDNI